jgi:hypothetical protein
MHVGRDAHSGKKTAVWRLAPDPCRPELLYRRSGLRRRGWKLRRHRPLLLLLLRLSLLQHTSLSRAGPRQEEDVDDQGQDKKCSGQNLGAADQKVGGPANTEHHTYGPAAKRPGKATAFAGLHQHNQHQQDADDDLKND